MGRDDGSTSLHPGDLTVLRYAPPPERVEPEGFKRYGTGEWREEPRQPGEWLENFNRPTRLRKTEFVPHVLHEVTHFTHPDPDAEDEYGRARWVTYHAFIRPETEHGDWALLGETHQYSYSRDWPPPLPEHVLKFTRHLRRRHESQVTVSYFLCDDDLMRVSERLPVADRWGGDT